MDISVIATGDSLFTADFPVEYGKKRKSLDRFIGSSDVKLTNLETNVGDFGGYANQYSGGTWINVRKELFGYLKSFGFDFYGTANNHCMDYGHAGLLNTLNFLDEEGLKHAGTGKSLKEASAPAILSANGKKVAVIAVDSSLEQPSMAGKSSKVFAARPGVNYLRFTNNYCVSEKELSQLKDIARKTSLNFTRQLSIDTGFIAPDKEGTFVFGNINFTTDALTPKSSCNSADLLRLTEDVKKAAAENDYVFVLIHCHENDGVSHANPPAYLKEFCHAVIDAGAHAVFGGGCHELRGMEIYGGRPVFYSLGDFIYQGMRVEYLPPEFMEKYGVDLNATAYEGLMARSRGGKVGLQTQEQNFLTVLPKITFSGGVMTDMKIMPVKLGFGTGSDMEGLPYFAEGEEGEKIFRIFSALSAPFGVNLKYKNGYMEI